MALVGTTCFAISALTAAVYDGYFFKPRIAPLQESPAETIVETINYYIPIMVYEQIPVEVPIEVPVEMPATLPWKPRAPSASTL